MLNSVKGRPKRSKLEKDMGRFVWYLFIFLILLCSFAALYYSIWEESNERAVNTYILADDNSFVYNFFVRFGNWLLTLGNFIPISLLLTLETVKFLQGLIIGIDQGLVSSNNIECKVNTSALNEELGQVDYIFSDKTGTLTRNDMRFKYLIVGNTAYGEKTGYSGEMPKVKNVDFSDPTIFEALPNGRGASQFGGWGGMQNGRGGQQPNATVRAVQQLALCHTIVVEKSGEFSASSPDELAFVNFAKLVGCEFKGIDDDNNVITNEWGQDKNYKQLDVFEFTSDRKRMSVIMKDSQGKITLYTKGADSIMKPRFAPNSELDVVMRQLDKYAEVGLRTLLLGCRELSQSEYQQFKSQYEVA